MALLAFEDTRSSPVADLMDISQRQKTASELNAAILSSQCQVWMYALSVGLDQKSVPSVEEPPLALEAQ